MPGQTFTPGLNQTQENRNPNSPLQYGAEALRQLTLRLPQTLGGSPIAPTSLLTPRLGGGGVPGFLGLQQGAGLSRPPGGPPPGSTGQIGAGAQGPVQTPSIGPQGGGVSPGLQQILQQLFGGQNPFIQTPTDQGPPQGGGNIPTPNIGFGGGGGFGGGMPAGPGAGMGAPPAGGGTGYGGGTGGGLGLSDIQSF